MPAPRDLTGQRFGRLTCVEVVARTDRAGRWWRCTCDCGNQDVLPQNRLTVPDGDCRAVRECSTCRGRSCSICGTRFLTSGQTATCGSDDCRREHRRLTNRAIEDRAREARAQPRRPSGSRHRSLADFPILRLALEEAERDRARERRIGMTPDQRERRRELARSRYAENPQEYQARYRAWIDGMTPERRAKFEADQARRSRQYKRRRAEAQMLRDAAELMQFMENRDE